MADPILKAAYEKLEGNLFWIEYRKRLASLRDLSASTATTMVVSDQAGLWNLARSQGSFVAYRTALSLPETMTGLRDPEGK